MLEKLQGENMQILYVCHVLRDHNISCQMIIKHYI